MFGKDTDATTSGGGDNRQTSILAQGCRFEGKVTVSGTFRVEGEFKGDIATPEQLIIGKTGVVNGTVKVKNAMIGGQLHAAIASFPKVALGLSYLDLYEDTQCFYCGAGHPLFEVEDARIDVDAIRRHPIIGRTYWGQRDLKSFAVGGAKAVVSDMESEARLILSGAYLGYLPEHFAARFVAEGRLRAVRSDLFAYAAPFQIAFAPDRARQPVLRLFLEKVRDLFPRAAGGG